jgi:hypothetical protein
MIETESARHHEKPEGEIARPRPLVCPELAAVIGAELIQHKRIPVHDGVMVTPE